MIRKSRQPKRDVQVVVEPWLGEMIEQAAQKDNRTVDNFLRTACANMLATLGADTADPEAPSPKARRRVHLVCRQWFYDLLVAAAAEKGATVSELVRSAAEAMALRVGIQFPAETTQPKKRGRPKKPTT